MFINSMFSHCAVIESEFPDIKSEVEKLTQKRLRRADRYIQMAMYGALACHARYKETWGKGFSQKTVILLATSVGTNSTCINMQENIALKNIPPKPFLFVNSLGNTACFFIASGLGFDGANLALSNEDFTFESAITHAKLVFDDANDSDFVLLGSVDEAVLPLAEHAVRNNFVGEFRAAYEGSHWLYLSRTPQEESVAEVKERQYFNSLDALTDFLDEQGSKNIDVYCNKHLSRLPELASTLDARFSQECVHQPERDIIPHGTYSGASFSQALNAFDGRGQAEEHAAEALIMTVDKELSRFCCTRLCAIS